MADTQDDLSHLITEESDHDVGPAPTSRTGGTPGRKKKDKSKEEELPEVNRQELEEFRAFQAAKAADVQDAELEEQPAVIELDGQTFRVAKIDEDVMGHIQAVLMFTSSSRTTADNRQDLNQLAGILEALMEPGEWDRLREVAMNYVVELRNRAHQAKLEGRDDDVESYSIVALLNSILEGIMEEFQEAAANPKR